MYSLRKGLTLSELLNCWEFNNCGRELEGKISSELGTCPAAEDRYSDGINGGRNGGRICWSVAGTFSGDGIAGTFARERFSCINCDFFKLVDRETGIEKFELLTPARLYNYKHGNHNRREYMRFDIHLDIEVMSGNKKGASLPGVTRNLSTDGLSFVSENFELNDQDSFQLRIKNPEKGSFIESSGEIIWKKQIRDRCLAGIKIKSIEKNDHIALLGHAYSRWITAMRL